MNIEISLRSQKLIKNYLLASGVHPRELPSLSLPTDFVTLMSWLDEEQIKIPRNHQRKKAKN